MLALLFGPLAFGAVEAWSLAVLELLIFSTVALLAWRGFSWPAIAPARPLVLALAAVAAIGVFQAAHLRRLELPGLLWAPFTTARAPTLRAVLLWFAYAGMAWTVPQLVRDRESARRLVWLVFAFGVCLSAIGLIQRGQGNLWYYGLRPVRYYQSFGPYVNRDHAASFLAMTAMAGGGLGLSYLSRILDGRKARGALADLAALGLLVLFGLGVILYGIRTTTSRGAVHAMAATIGLSALAAGGFLGRARRTALRAAFALGAAGYAAFLWTHPRWVGVLGDVLDISLTFRLSIYRSCLQILRDFPAFGTGLGTFLNVYPSYQESLVPGFVSHAHSDWLELLVQAGWIGAAAFGAGVFTLFVRTVRSWRAMESREGRCLVGGLLAASLCFALHGAIEFTFQIPGNAVLFLTLASLAACAAQTFGRGSASPVRAAPAGVRWTLGGAALLLGAGVFLLPRFQP